jgi:hypothetical protein
MMSLDPVQGTVYNPLSSLSYILESLPNYMLSLSAVSIKTVSFEQKPELVLQGEVR